MLTYLGGLYYGEYRWLPVTIRLMSDKPVLAAPRAPTLVPHALEKKVVADVVSPLRTAD